jgi:hypothetical protein
MVMTVLTDKVRSRGHWQVAIRPSTFVEHRVRLTMLHALIDNAAVRLRGWPVPLVDGRVAQPLTGDDWIGQDVDAEVVSHYEAWRFFTSGQFSHLRAVSADWRVGNEKAYIPAGANAVIEVWEILFYLTEVFELAARLSLTDAGDEEMTVDATVHAGDGRVLVVQQAGRGEFMNPYRVPSTISQSRTLHRQDLIGTARVAAVDMASAFFSACGWNAPHDQLIEHQAELLNYY